MSGSGFDISFQHQLAQQSWSLYAVGMLVIAVRLYARIHRVGIANLAPDDWLMLLAAGFYTALIVCLNVIASGGGSNLFPPEQLQTFTPQDIQERVKGSKIVLVSEQAMLNVIWTLKVCMLYMFSRLTMGTLQRRAVKYLAIYVGVGYFSVEVAFFTACRPFNGYWAVPPPDPQCTTLQHYAIIQACFNLSSDVAILLVPLPMVINLKLPLKQKIILCMVFSMGIFVITAAILTKVYNLSDVYDTSYMLWYTREASVAVYVANLPMIWPLLREYIPFLRSISSRKASSLPVYGNSSHINNTGTSKGGDKIIHLSYIKSTSDASTEPDTPAEARRGQFGKGSSHFGGKRTGSFQSDERVLNEGFWGSGKGDILVENEFTVEGERTDLDKGPSDKKSAKFEWGANTFRDRQVRIEGGSSELISIGY